VMNEHPLLLPPRLAGLLRRLASTPPPRLTVPHDLTDPRWLFPGRCPRQPIGNRARSDRLNRHATASPSASPATARSPHSLRTYQQPCSPSYSTSTCTPPFAGSTRPTRLGRLHRGPRR
jgi:hypothetical protein